MYNTNTLGDMINIKLGTEAYGRFVKGNLGTWQRNLNIIKGLGIVPKYKIMTLILLQTIIPK